MLLYLVSVIRFSLNLFIENNRIEKATRKKELAIY